MSLTLQSNKDSASYMDVAGKNEVHSQMARLRTISGHLEGNSSEKPAITGIGQTNKYSSCPSIYVTGPNPQYNICHDLEKFPSLKSQSNPVLENDWISKLKENVGLTNYDILNCILEELIELDMVSGASPVARMLIMGFMDILNETGLHPTPISRSVEAVDNLGVRQIQLRNFLTLKCNQNEDIYENLKLFLNGLIQSMCSACWQESPEHVMNCKQWLRIISVLSHLLSIDFVKERPTAKTLITIINNIPETVPEIVPLEKESPTFPNMEHFLICDRNSCGPIEPNSSSTSLTPAQQSSEDILEASDVETGMPNRKDAETSNQPAASPWRGRLKIACLLVLWLIFTVVLISKGESDERMHQISIPVGEVKDFWLREHPSSHRLKVSLRGAFLPLYYSNLTSNYVSVWIQLVEIAPGLEPISNLTDFSEQNIRFSMNLTEPWNVSLVPSDSLDFVPSVDVANSFELNSFDKQLEETSILRVQMATNIDAILPVGIVCDVDPIDTEIGIYYGAAVLVGLYILIIFEIIPRTLAAMMATTMTLAILAAMGDRPTTKEIISWIDNETMLLLFSMMMLVSFLADTGFFDCIATYAYKITKGNISLLIVTFGFITAIVSTVLDNVTTILLFTPVIIRLCEASSINPIPIIISSVIFSNIGGSLTPVGDPPNVIIASNEIIAKSGVDFLTFALNMGGGVIVILFVTFFQIRFIYRKLENLNYTMDNRQLHRAAAFKRAAVSMSSYSKNEEDVRRTLRRQWYKILRKITGSRSTSVGRECTLMSPNEDLAVMKEYRITDVPLLIKSLAALIFVIVLFFLHSIPSLHLSMGWSALLGTTLLLILVDEVQLDSVIKKVEWGTLIFFASLFIMMEGLSRLGLISWIGQQTERVILSVNKESQLAVAILLILWVSALSSAFIDNIPLTTMMVRIVTALAENQELDLPLKPLVWALAFGACLGGNGTLIGASANVIAVSVAEAHGYGFTFMEYFKVGFPVMLANVSVASVYLLVCHVYFQWY